MPEFAPPQKKPQMITQTSGILQQKATTSTTSKARRSSSLVGRNISNITAMTQSKNHSPSVFDHLRPPIGGVGRKGMNEERWFETRYANYLAAARKVFVEGVNFWVRENWGQPVFNQQIDGFNIYARGKFRNDDTFQDKGDKPQTEFEADKVLGSFRIDIVTPIQIHYLRTNPGHFTWESEMYIEDVLGLQKHDWIYNRLTAWMFPSRRVIRAKWKISGDGRREN